MLSSSLEPPHRFESVRSPRLPGVEMVLGYHSGPPTRWQYWPMVQIAWLETGRARLWAHGQSAIASAGDTTVSAPGCSPRVVERLTATASTCTVWISPLAFDRVAQAPCPRARDLGVSVIHGHQAIGAALKALERALRSEDGPAEARLACLVAEAWNGVRTSQRTALPAGPLRPEVARAQRLLQERLQGPVSLDEMARESGLSKFHFVRLFREELGITPHAYAMKLRVARARELLDGGVPAAQVAFECGFADQAHFTRAFKREVGYTPAAFARLG